ncbi:hypothetical protein D3C76_226370 [compost metagenome]
MAYGIFTGDHLRVHIRFHTVNFADVFQVSRSDFLIDLKSSVAMTQHGFSNHDPWVVVAENTRIFLVARRVRRNFAQVQIVLGVRRLLQNDTVFRIQTFLYGSQRFSGLPVFYTDTGHYADTLRLDENLAFLVFLAADFVAVVVVSAQEPVAVEAVGQRNFTHIADLRNRICSYIVQSAHTANFGIVRSHEDEQTCDKHGFRYAACDILSRLERFARLGREAVQVQTVIPVRASDQRQAMRSEVIGNMLEGTLQMLEQGSGIVRIAVKRNLLIQNRIVAGFLDVGSCSRDQPERIIIEAGADFVVAFFGERLVLVIRAAVFELGSGDIQNTLSGTLRDLVHEAEQVLVGVTEAHAAANPGFEIGSGTGHVERNHTLVRIPDVNHAVKLLVAALNLIFGQQVIPVCSQNSQSSIYLGVCSELFDNSQRRLFVDDVQRFPFLIFRIFDIAEYKNEALLFTGFQCDVQSMGADWRPAAGYRVGGFTGSYSLRSIQAIVHAYEGFTVCIETGDFFIYRVESVVVSALTVFSFVINHGILDFNFAGAEVTLEVGHIILGIPETEFGKREQLYGFLGGTGVFNHQTMHFGIVAHRYKSKLIHRNAVPFACDGSIAQTMAALVEIEVALNRHPARSPEITVVIQVVVASACIQGNIVIPVTGKSSHPGIPVKGVAAGSIGDQAEKLLVAEVVDPWVRRFGSVDYILFASVVKGSEFH